ncbi:MAG: hypothetical protein ACK5NN_04605 [Sphingomonadaceae bacterium]
MAATNSNSDIRENDPADIVEGRRLPLGGRHAQAVQRLQIGMAGLGAVILMIGLAQIVTEKARETDATTVPEAVASPVANTSSSPRSDPLVDAGVVPDLPADPTPSATQPAPVLPEQGQGNEAAAQQE